MSKIEPVVRMRYWNFDFELKNRKNKKIGVKKQIRDNDDDTHAVTNQQKQLP